MAATAYDDIYAIAAPEDFVVIRGRRIRVHKFGIRKFAMLARRFPDAGFLQQLQAGRQAEDGEVDLDLGDAEVVIAMAAAAVGRINDQTAEDHLEEAFGLDELQAIISKSVEMMAAGAPEGFSSRSA